MRAEPSERTIDLLNALSICVGEIARTTKEILDRDTLTADERQALRSNLARTIQNTAARMNQAAPSAGQYLSNTFHGYPGEGQDS